uniref:Major capsid protein N-terminal domain-containing protein n=1 Tax=viral metagenome TaxID=1070528 RepID=A0A6C0AC02_9ZZZZ
MAGGLLQIASYGSQDIYLTGNPEITFFKVVYRRHTNFSVESLEIPFENSVEFGNTSTSFLPLAGDLASTIYLQIILPKLDFTRNHTTSDDFLTNYNNAKDNHYIVQNYVEVMVEAYRLAVEDNEAFNVEYSETIAETIEQYFTDGGGFNERINAYSLLEHTYSENSTNFRTIANDYADTEETPKSTIMNRFESAIYFLKQELKTYYNTVLETKRLYDDDINENIKIAWVDKIGHNILEYVDVSIGGNRINRHYGEYLTIWNELTQSPYKDDEYNKMIGNISTLTNFDRNIKPSYTLRIPLQFWFCRYSGLALPLLALQHTEVSIDIKLREFKDLAYIEENTTILVDDEEFNLDELTDDEGIILEASLLVDYVYLDQPERRRFAQSAHEYLIDQVQMIEFKDVDQDRYTMLLDFFHPSKEIIWTAQKTSYRSNPNGFVKTNFDKFTMTEETVVTTNKYTGQLTSSINYKDSPIQNSYIDFNGYTRAPLLDSTYYSKVIPWATHSRSPDDGIHVFSMALHPEDSQPSGQGNLSRVSKGVLGMDFFTSAFTGSDDEDTTLNIRMYCRNINILRFVGGMAGLAYIS